MTRVHANRPSTDADAGSRGIVGVLGGLGFIGRQLCLALARTGYRVRALDRERSTGRASLHEDPAIEIVEGDVTRAGDFFRMVDGVRVVVDLAYATVPGTSMLDPEHDVLGNVASAVSWLGRLGETAVERVVSVSSGGTVYGIPHYLPIDEEHPTNPISSYGVTKLAIEKYVAMYSALADVEHAIVRPSNVYGPGQRIDSGQGIVGIFLDRALRGEEIEIWGSGQNVRDFLFVDDMVAAILELVSYQGPLSVFNVSSGVGHSVDDVVAAIEHVLGARIGVRRLPAREFDVPVNVLSSRRMHEATGWRAHTTLEAGLEKTLACLGVARPERSR